jgi:hypothetical protein
MYRWIWRKLPYGVPGKIAGVVVFLGGIVGLLWYGVFPAVDPHLPFNNVQVTTPDGAVPHQDVVTPSPSVSRSHSLPK